MVFDPPKDLLESNGEKAVEDTGKAHTKKTNLNVEFSESLLEKSTHTANIHHDNLTTEFHTHNKKEEVEEETCCNQSNLRLL